MLSALLAPVSMLAEEVRTGKLGGICSLNAASSVAANSGSGDAQQAGAHCEMCASLGWALAPLAVWTIPTFAGHRVAAADFPSHVAATIPGLPFSRGPPVILT